MEGVEIVFIIGAFAYLFEDYHKWKENGQHLTDED